MNIYHITYAPIVRTINLHFWGCNLKCRACLLKKELHDCHLAETRDGIFNRIKKRPQIPERFLDLGEVPISILVTCLRQTHTAHISQKNSSKEVSYVQEGAALEV